MNTLLIEKQTGGYFKFTLNEDTANAITSIQNDLLAVGNQLHFKTGNGANIIKEQFIYPADVTIVAGGTFTFTTVAQVWDKLIDIDYFAWLGGGGGGGVDRFDDLLDTFQYTGNAGKAVVVDNSELRLVPIILYNKRLFTELEDTPSSLLPNKMLVVNPSGTAVVLQDQPQPPEQFLNSVGYFDYNDLITQTVPLTIVANVPKKLTNDTEGANTSTDQNPYGVSYVWDYTTNQFNFNELEVGDTIDVRIHVQVTTTTSNQKVSMSAKFGIGSVSEFTNSIYENMFKSSGTHEVSFVAPFYMGSTYITDYPAELYLTSDATATVKVDGWYVRILRKNINIITVDYQVDDATTTSKGIVRLAGDLAGTANNPTVPELANKVPTSRTVGTTSPLLGGGALSSNLTLSIQQANSVDSGYLTYADWGRFDEAHRDRIVSAAVTGTTTKTLTLTQHDAGTITTSWTDDNTDAVSSVFGRTGAVVAVSGDYTTSLVTESTNKNYQTDNQKLYNDATSSIQTQLNSKQPNLSGSGIVKSTGGTISYLTDNTANWDDAYNNKITTAAVTGTTTKTLTLNQQDGGTVTASWTDNNTDAVTSVFGRTGAIVSANGDYTTTQVTEGTNLYYTEGRVSANADVAANTAARHSAVALGASINGLDLSGQVLSLGLASTSANGALSSTDWNTFNSKQSNLSGSGIVKSTAGVITYLTDNTSNWDDAYNNKITTAAVTGTTTKTLTLNQQDGGTVTASWTDDNTGNVTSVFGRSGAVVAASGDYTTTQVTEGTNLYYTNTRVSANTDVAANTAARHSAVTLGASTNGLSLSGQALSLALASPTTRGALTSEDYNYFFDKVQGDGDTNYIARYVGGKQIQNSQIFDNGTSVGIGTITPSFSSKLEVNGNVLSKNDAFAGFATNVGIKAIGIQTLASGGHYIHTQEDTLEFGTRDAFPLIIKTNANNRLVISAAGASTFYGTVTAMSIIKSGGTSSQYLMADGSVSTVAGVTGTGASGQVAFWNGTSSITGESTLFWDSTNDRLGIGGSPIAKFSIDSGALPSAANSYLPSQTIYSSNTNGEYFEMGSLRTAAGSDWTFSGFRLQERIDSTWMGYMQFNGDSNNGGISFGTGTSAVSRQSISESMRITSGRNVLIGTQTDAGYKLDVNGTGRIGTSLNTPLIGVNATPSSGYPLTVGCTSGASGIKIIGRNDNLGYIEFFNSNGLTVNSSINGSTSGLQIVGATTFSSSIKPDSLKINTDIDRGKIHIATSLPWGTKTNDVLNITSYGYAGDVYTEHNAGSIKWWSADQQVAAITAWRNIPASGDIFDLAFSTNPGGNNMTERMRIFSGGNVGIGTGATNSGNKLDVIGAARVTGNLTIDNGELNVPKKISFGANRNTGGSYGDLEWYNYQWDGLIKASIGAETSGALSNGALVFRTSDGGVNATERMRIAGNGAATFTSTVTATAGFFNSDMRLKDLTDYDYSVSDIKPITYLWKDGRDDKKHVGYSAQEVQKVMPDAVNEGTDGMLSVNYVEVLVAKIAQMEKEIELLKSR